MKFEVTILGSNSATPVYNRNPTAQLLNCNEKYYLIDCGEGTQQQMIKCGFKISKIDYIFISHLHGDHYFGLIGLLSSMHLNGRTRSVKLFCPEPLQEILELQFKHSETILRYAIEYIFTSADNSMLIFENTDLTVHTIILSHRIPCTGFRFSQKKRMRKLIMQKVEEADLDVSYYPMLKRGLDIELPDGRLLRNADYTVDSDQPKSYGYCSDTIFTESYFESIQNCDTLYHESTFMHDMLDRANQTFHTTALQAAEVALRNGVKRLIIGHYSSRYKALQPMLDEARTIFPNTELAIEGTTYTI
jgi:ribonuclease Z